MSIAGRAGIYLIVLIISLCSLLGFSTPAYGQSVVTAAATRSLPSASITPGTNFNIVITASGYGIYCQIAETLPAGFSYVSSTLSPAAVTHTGQIYKFTLLGEASFTYTVTASSTVGSYTFNGVLKDENLVSHAVGGNSLVTVAFSVASYDTNGDGIISKGEALKAVQDYFNGTITKGQVLEVVVTYFNSTPIPTPTPTPTPTPSPSPSPTPTPALVLFQDDFSNAYSGWDTYSVQQGSAFYYNGWLHIIANPNSGRVEASRYQGWRFSNFILDVDTKLVSGSDSNWHIICCRDNGSNSNYLFGISADGYYYIDKWVNGLGTSITSPTASIYIQKGVGITNHITIECIDSNLRLSANGHLLSSVTDSTFTSGLIALCAYARGSLYTEVAYDNIIITTLDTENEIIVNFLNDTHVNAMLWEEWNIFNEFNYGYTLYALSGYSWSYYVNTWYYPQTSLYNRANANYNDIASITIPGPISSLLSPFWDGIELAMKDLREAMSMSMPYALKDFALRAAFRQNWNAWNDLGITCWSRGITIPWPLPPWPSWPTPDSPWQ